MESLKFSYGSKTALNGLDLSVREGSIHALLGPNGAGKSTLLRLLLNLLQPQEGRATLLDLDSRKLKPQDLQWIGYAAEDQKLPEWMTVKQLLDYCRPMYTTWDSTLVGQLLDLFDLPISQKIRTFSLGMKRKLSILLAVAFRPQLLLLDEPFSGLDPLTLEDLLTGLLELVGENVWTVLISTHNMNIVERLADHVSFLDRGRLLLDEPLESIQARFRKISLSTEREASLPENLPESWLVPRVAGRLVEWVESRYEPGQTEADAQKRLNAREIQTSNLNLNEIYISLLRDRKGRAR